MNLKAPELKSPKVQENVERWKKFTTPNIYL
jgi:hypothetical protein